ncbi:acetate/propionate family kinase (plasmid) [Bermanella sp. WJH001]|uniref:acetate/propionate family kinase n=1 Tax=Bermanella sp. WJH001 TaxID=3048005 RepID=UPI0024BEA8AE|nr:acetate kinase [Bermanella sp. WJH001]MDJ1539489.1 acetate kinase [Bermanella sp. WJH001]
MTHEYTLVLNCGSSSLKFAVLQPLTGDCAIQGLAERLGSDQASISYQVNETKHKILLTQGDHQGAISAVIELLKEQALLQSIKGVGHRVVHGGEAFSESLLINADNLKQLKTLSHLAPLHNPVNLLGIEAINTLLPELPQVAVFDTAFHQTLPEAAYLYALPYEYYEKHDVRRYGFHGTSYRYVSEKSASILNKPLNESHFLIAHLGNGCSACAIRNGVSVDTSMGLTPLEGLAMGTRSGDVDPGLMPFLCERLNISTSDVMDILNKKSGLLGISGISNDMRELQQAAEQGDVRANLAIEVFAFKIARYLGALAVSLPRIDALIFTGGIGENDRFTRALILEHLAILGFEIDGQLNKTNGDEHGRISTQSSPIAMVVATNEELMIAKDTFMLTQA